MNKLRGLRGKKGLAAVGIFLLLTGAAAMCKGAFGVMCGFADQWEDTVPETFGAYYALISENDDMLLWDSVYEGARKEGEENDAWVELFGDHLLSEVTTADKLSMAIDAGVDGIILSADESSAVEELVGKARQKGIPVITVLNDGAEDIRQCFVGVNSYHLGKEYARRIWELLQEMQEDCRIQVLFNTEDVEAGKNALFLSLRGSLEELAAKGEYPWEIEVSTVAVDGSDAFQIEEAIRFLMVQESERPKILMCLSEADTRRACEAAVDYNCVGEVRILGYYESRQVLDGIAKNIIDSTITVDGAQVGSLCVKALTEYRKTGYVNSYFPVDTHLINVENVSEYLERYPE